MLEEDSLHKAGEEEREREIIITLNIMQRIIHIPDRGVFLFCSRGQ